VALALELEGLWNDLASLLPFALPCGYPARLLTTAGSGAVEQVCRLHTGVTTSQAGLPAVTGNSVNGHEAVRSFPCDDDSPRAARRFVVSRLSPRAAAAMAVDAEIVAAELAANAIVHARTPFTVAVWQSGHSVRIRVRDAAPLPPGAPPLRPVPGHGLDMVARIANRWGVQPQAGGKAIWAELTSAPPER
jgi:Histidine kinase-like ATPase domain